MGKGKRLLSEYRRADASGRSRMTARVSMLAHFSAAACKMAAGVFALSGFLVISGLYSAGIGTAKGIYDRGAALSRGNRTQELRYYRNIAMILLISALAYMTWMARLFFSPPAFRYGRILGIGIAALSFWDLGAAIWGLVDSGKRKDILLSGLRTVNLSSAMTALVLTQTAILSFTHEPTVQAMAADARSNAVLGLLVGCVSCILSVWMLFRYRREARQMEKGSA